MIYHFEVYDDIGTQIMEVSSIYTMEIDGDCWVGASEPPVRIPIDEEEAFWRGFSGNEETFDLRPIQAKPVKVTLKDL